MTSDSQKRDERNFVLKASQLLNTSWEILEQREKPDFIIKEDALTFGLEVREIFLNENQNKGGSPVKQTEQHRSKELEKFAQGFEKTSDLALHVRLLRKPDAGNISQCELKELHQALMAENLESRETGYQTQFLLRCGTKVWVTKEFHSRWYVVNDRVGWVSQDPIELIQAAIDTKCKKLNTYRKNAGPDIRLLLVANHLNNSGKITLSPTTSRSFDLQGFTKVYFLSHPSEALVL
ncbi:MULTISPECIES: hypothetical protein [unclassified Thalassospira]|uniref:hypothetical protein n=1 Tax=unclassified Thalassospira TaxID=2648997 RepID=UPI0007921023|nr:MULTISPECIES: hypothetical protein [unclassified Thalassospira]KXJ57981.1 MAG: hypothetical protein AXW12_19360 [Thalassospira sp. Nap_22]KZD00400.1 hypothetical protein AUQ41_07415 [Thalassospira sp. MCCC 1A02898]ONH87289.1 hypothetical protein TH47_12295 [Thalassospira sp. MCCC 1A02803]